MVSNLKQLLIIFYSCIHFILQLNILMAASIEVEHAI